MRKLVLILASAAIVAAGCAMTAPAKDDGTVVCTGTWSSSSIHGAGGALKVAVAPPRAGRLTGTVLFYRSSCPRETPFQGVDDGQKRVLVAYLGAPCGRVRVELVPEGNGYTGTYDAEFTDKGSVELSR